MKVLVTEKQEPGEPMALRPGLKVWADVDSDNRIINLVIETKKSHKLIQVAKVGGLDKAFKLLKQYVGRA